MSSAPLKSARQWKLTLKKDIQVWVLKQAAVKPQNDLIAKSINPPEIDWWMLRSPKLSQVYGEHLRVLGLQQKISGIEFESAKLPGNRNVFFFATNDEIVQEYFEVHEII